MTTFGSADIKTPSKETLTAPVLRGRKMRFGIGDHVFLVDCLDDWSALAVSKLIATWFITTSFADTTVPDCTIRVRCGASVPRVPIGLEKFDVADGGVCHSDGETIYLDLDGSLIVIRPLAGPDVEVWIRKPYDLSSRMLAQILSQALGAAWRRCQLFLLHSAGVTPPGRNRALLIAGESGSGKSTLTFQLAKVGWGFLSDDSMLLTSGPHGVKARGLRKFFALTPNTMSAVQLETASVGPTTSVFKRRVMPEEFFPEGQIKSAPVGGILFPVVTNQPESRLKRLAPTETMARLLRLCPWACYDKPTAGANLKLFGRLAQEAPAYDLLAGNELLGNPALTAELVSTAFADL